MVPSLYSPSQHLSLTSRPAHLDISDCHAEPPFAKRPADPKDRRYFFDAAKSKVAAWDFYKY